MKKFISFLSLLIAVNVLFQVSSMNVDAKTQTFSKSFAEKVKKGTLPNSKGKIGMSYNKLKKVEKGTLQEMYNDPSIMVYYSDKSSYNFFNNFGNYKVQSISQQFEHAYSLKSFQKYFGQPYKAKAGKETYKNSGIYKAGQYYVYFDTRTSWGGTSYIEVGTKKMILKSTGYAKIYR